MSTHKHSLVWLVLALTTCLLKPAAAATLELTGPAGATVSVNDRQLGTFPLASPLDLPPGRYTIRCELAGHTPFAETISIAEIDDWQRLTVRPVPYSQRTAWSSNLLLAGLGLHHTGHHIRGYTYNAAEVGGLLTALAGEMSRQNLSTDYEVLMNQYHSTINGDEALRLGKLAEATYQDMQNQQDLRDLGLMVAGGAIALSIIDALITFPGVAAGTGAVPLDTGHLETTITDDVAGSALHLGARLTF